MTRQTMKRRLLEAAAAKGRGVLPSALFAAAECAPLSKTGGLADVAGALPAALIDLGFDCRVITPFHRAAKEKYGARTEHVCDFNIGLGWRSQYVGIEKLALGKTAIYLVDNEYYFGSSIYWGGADEGEQYAFFQRAVLEAMPRMGFIPDILHCNDWHTALMPMLIKAQYYGTPLGNVKTLLTIHNLHFQGKFDFQYIQGLLGLDGGLYSPRFMEAFGCANFLKSGCVFADGLSTVSPTYAREIQTPELGEGLEGIFHERQEGLKGILNGIDKRHFNPKTDSRIPARFSAADLSGKALCKTALLEELGLEPGFALGSDPGAESNRAAPVIGMVSRITAQKGFDLVLAALPGLIDLGYRVALLGAGDPELENAMRAAEAKYKGHVCAYIGYNEGLANRIYAGSDFFLMPSRFEPCGISQMLAMRYGTLPIVRETGGLVDTVTPYNQFTGEGTGFSFAGADADELYSACARAAAVYAEKEVMEKLIQNAMAMDFGFTGPAYEYGMEYIEIL
ncbi:MAG: glycogen synthase [Firmicutes bacterium]|nr:glycogen synthase [Bacillota bacterium]